MAPDDKTGGNNGTVGIIAIFQLRGAVAVPLHDKDGFFKYYTAESAKLTLAHTSRKWSTPRLFNDPFDNQFNLYYEEPSEELAEQQLRQFHEILTSPEPLKPNQFGPMTPKAELIRQVRLQHPDLKYTDDEMAYLREGVIEGMRRVIQYVPTMNAEYLGWFRHAGSGATLVNTGRA